MHPPATCYSGCFGCCCIFQGSRPQCTATVWFSKTLLFWLFCFCAAFFKAAGRNVPQVCAWFSKTHAQFAETSAKHRQTNEKTRPCTEKSTKRNDQTQSNQYRFQALNITKRGNASHQVYCIFVCQSQRELLTCLFRLRLLERTQSAGQLHLSQPYLDLQSPKILPALVPKH